MGNIELSHDETPKNTAITQPMHSPPRSVKPLANFTLITLDLDETVWPSKEVLQQAEEIQFKWLQKQAARLTAIYDLESLRAHRRLIRAQRPEIAHDLTAVRIASLRLLLKELGYSVGLAETAVTVFLEARNWVTPYADVAPVLERLAQTFCLASLTNGNADVHCTLLKPHFRFSFMPSIVGAAKPAPAMFHWALKQAGAKPHQAVHVGDHPEYDVIAAQQIGMRAVWINREEVPWPAHLPPPDAIIKDFYELESWLTEAAYV